MDQILLPPNTPNREFGLFKVEDCEVESLAMSVCDWGKLYEAIIRSVLTGTWKPEEDKQKKSISYWVGLEGEVIDILTSKDLPIGTTRLINLLKRTIKNRQFHPFGGIIYAQGHIEKQAKNGFPTPEQLMTMNWLCENIEGRIPDIEELQDEKQEIVRKLGVKKS
ncbi:hypothetical protein P261_01042 [Lachnospiraceae bacterium TWA4]|nr:hypothetical protein P261_01042 [Lachnospiraceae bacterium TWA4]